MKKKRRRKNSKWLKKSLDLVSRKERERKRKETNINFFFFFAVDGLKKAKDKVLHFVEGLNCYKVVVMLYKHLLYQN